MKARLVVGIALGVAGCHHSDPVIPDAPVVIDAAVDASPFTTSVHGTLVSLATENAADGSPVPTTSPPDPTTTHLSVHRDDGTSDPVELSLDGTFEFGLLTVGQRYRVTLAIDGQPPKDFQSSAATLDLALTGAGRTPRTPLAADIVVKAVFSNWVDGDTAFLDSTGLWTATSQQFVTNPPPSQTEPWAFQWSWSAARSLSGAIGLLDASAHDVLQVTEWHPDPAGYTSMVAALVHSDITMANGTNLEFGADDVPIPIPALTQRCLHVVAKRRTELARIATAVPDTYFEGVDAWDLEVGAGSGIGVTGAQPIAIGSEDAGSGSGPGSATDADLTASFGNPFGGDTLLVSTSAHEVREVHATPGDDARFLQVGTESWAQVAMPVSCAATPATVEAMPVVAIPSFPALAGVTLDHDDAVVPSTGTGDVAVTWTDAAAGVGEEYVAELFEATTVNGAATLTLVHSVFTADHATAFDASELQMGHTYMIEIFARQGFPGAATGDFRTIAFPFASSVTLSHTFTIVLPI